MFMMDCIRRMKGVDEMIVDSVFNSGDSLGVTESTVIIRCIDFVTISKSSDGLQSDRQMHKEHESEKKSIQFVIFSDVFL